MPKGWDHDPPAKEKLTPFGILMVATGALLLVFGVVIGCFVWNIIGIIRVASAPTQTHQTVSERQEQLLDSLRNEKLHSEISKWARKAVD